MQYRPLGRTGFNVSDVSFGAWAIGGTWGPVKTMSRWRRCMRRWTAASTSSTPPMSTATGGANGCSRA